MPVFGMMYGYGKDGTVKQISSVGDMDLAKPRWARYNFQGTWTEKSAPDAVIECYENVGPNGERVVALVTWADDYDVANDRILSFFVEAAVWYSSATVNPVTAPVVAAVPAAAIAPAAITTIATEAPANGSENQGSDITQLQPGGTADVLPKPS